MIEPILYLIPVPLGNTPLERVLPAYNREVVLSLRHFIVENVRSARRFLKKMEPSIVIDKLSFEVLNEHTTAQEVSGLLEVMSSGESVGLMSEAGCPAVADPGADIVAIAQRKGYRVVPLVGPSSILLALMASGFNGQKFAFHGYLPVEAHRRAERIRALEARIYTEQETQIFIETPYRNEKLIDDLVRVCNPSTQLCVAVNITCSDEWIQSRPIKNWSKRPIPLQKKPAIFLLAPP